VSFSEPIPRKGTETLRKKKLKGRLSSVVDSSRKLNAEASTVNPQQAQGLSITSRVDAIANRMNQYESFKQQTKSEQKELFKQYLDDVGYLQSAVNQIEDQTSYLYAQSMSLRNTKDDVLNKLKQDTSVLNSVPSDVDVDRFLENHPSIIDLNHAYNEVEDTLRRNQSLMNQGGYYEQLKGLKDDLLSNPDLANRYVQESSSKVNRLMKDINFIGLGSYESELNRFINELETVSSISENRRRQMMIELETTSNILNRQKKKISLINVDLDNLVRSNQESTAVGRAAFLIDYKYNGINKLEQKLYYAVALLNRKPIL